MNRHQECLDVHLLLRRADDILLGQRQNTGFADGSWHLPSGHVEEGESAIEALVREAKEEVGVDIEPGNVRFVHLLHHRTNAGRVSMFFEVTRWEGEPSNEEPDKCAGWEWFNLADLPEAMIPYASYALSRVVAGSNYAERGWHDG